MEVRDATPEELASFTTPSAAECWGAVAVEDGEIVGHIALSSALGEVFGHDTAYWGKEPSGAARLWFNARKKAREMGAEFVNVHVVKDTDPAIVAFWKRLGFTPEMVVMRGKI